MFLKIVSSLSKICARTFKQKLFQPPEEGFLQWRSQTEPQTDGHGGQQTNSVKNMLSFFLLFRERGKDKGLKVIKKVIFLGDLEGGLGFFFALRGLIFLEGGWVEKKPQEKKEQNAVCLRIFISSLIHIYIYFFFNNPFTKMGCTGLLILGCQKD